MTPAQREAILAILAEANDITIATLRPDGWPQATTVSFVADGLTPCFGTFSHSQKAQNLLRDPRCSAAVDLPYRDWAEIRGLSLAARAEPITNGETAQRIGALMLAKFPQIGHFSANADWGETLLFRLTPLVFSRLDYRNGFGWTELIEA